MIEKERKSIIYRSRQGYVYQDKYALLKFFEYFKSGEIKNFYVDFPFQEFNSLDILVITTSDDKYIFEIKTGSAFDIPEFTKEIKTLSLFEKQNTDVSRIFMVVDPSEKHEVREHALLLGHLKNNERKPFYKKSYKNTLSDCYNEHYVFFESEKYFKSFLKKLEFIDNVDDNLPTGFTLSTLDNSLSSYIGEIDGETLNAGLGSEFPYHITVQELLNIIKQNAGSKKDLFPLLRDCLAKSLARRSVFSAEFTKTRVGQSIAEQIQARKETLEELFNARYTEVTPEQGSDTAFKRINIVIKEGSYLKNKKLVLEFLRDPEYAYYFFNKLLKNFERLKDVSFMLDEMLKTKNFFPLNKILEGSISEYNNEFILDFIFEHYESFTIQQRTNDQMYKELTLHIVKKILETDLRVTIIEKVFSFVKKIISLRGDEYKEDGSRFDNEKELIADILRVLFIDEQKREEIVTLISKTFDLVSGGHGLLMDTPREVFGMLRQYLDADFQNNLSRVVKLAIEQYDKRYQGDFDGFEWAGAGVSSSGGHFYLHDIDFVFYVLEPAVEKFYKDTGKFEFIKKNLVSHSHEVSRDRPDFLNRATIKVLLERYSSEDQGICREAFEILKEFIEFQRGIPSKSDLIYQEVRNRKGLGEEKIWALAVIDAEKYEIPTSIFLEQIVTDFASKGKLEAKDIVKKWQANPKYYEGSRGSNTIAEAVGKRLEDNFEEAVQLFKNFIMNEGFTTDKYDRFQVYSLAGTLAIIIKKNFDVGLDILNGLVKKERLSVNEQILMTNALSNFNVDGYDVDILERLYDNFVFPFLSSHNFSIASVVFKIPHDNAREQFVQFAKLLVEKDKIEEALSILRVFINDPDPYLPEDDRNGLEYNEHERILKGQRDTTITSVRGYCAWVLTKCAVLKGREYIKEIISLTEKLTKDRNLYVQHMACFPLSQLASVRLTHLEGKEELFLDPDKEVALRMAKEIERISFEFLGRIEEYLPEVQKSLSKSILSVFGHIRSLNQSDAERFINTFSGFPSEAIGEAAPLFIFFSEFRQDAYRDWRWKVDGLYDDLEEFDSRPFNRVLKEMITFNDIEVRKQFAFQFSILPDEGGVELFEIALRYLDMIVDFGYDTDIFRIIYSYFIPQQLGSHFEESYNLWRKCLEKEVKALNELHEKQVQNSVPNWIEHSHGEILLKVKEKKGEDQFLSSLKLFIQLPKGVNLYSIENAISKLKEFPTGNEEVEKMYNALIERNPKYYDEKQEWLLKDQ